MLSNLEKKIIIIYLNQSETNKKKNTTTGSAVNVLKQTYAKTVAPTDK